MNKVFKYKSLLMLIIAALWVFCAAAQGQELSGKGEVSAIGTKAKNALGFKTFNVETVSSDYLNTLHFFVIPQKK